MDSLLQSMDVAGSSLSSHSTSSIVGSLLLAFILGQVISWVYAASHSGMSYSRSFTQSLLLMTVIVSLVLYVIGNSIVTAFGLLGALSLIRFRNVLKDTKDAVFVFIALVVGMSVGSQRFEIAIVGTAMTVMIVLYLNWTAFGTMGRFDGFLTCRVAAGGIADPQQYLSGAIGQFCDSVKVVSTRRSAGTEGAELVYQIGLRDRDRSDDLVKELGEIQNVEHVSFVMRAELSEG